MRKPPYPSVVAAVCLSLWSSYAACADEVSRQPPTLYRQKFSALVTPLEEVLKASPSSDEATKDGVVLLDEEFHYLDEKGYRYMVEHRIAKANNDSGVKVIADDTYSFRKANQKIHLVLARTILPDGKRIALQSNAAILQTPQRQADYALYDDQAELRLIFPSVKPGAITESVVFIEESRFRIPGEYTAAWSDAFGWPARMIRRKIELPAGLAERLTVTNVGSSFSSPERQAVGKDRVRLTWKSGPSAALPSEPNRQPTRQIGPIVWLTTLKDWDALVRWYSPLVEARSALGPALAKTVDEWTSAASTPEEVLNILFSKVAIDVRYVGLEFGSSDLEPHDCTQVWANQYGDCKDKANLLRAMLLHKGIPAYLVLLNTENAGLIEKRSPDYRQFDHAIVAAEIRPGSYLFCDPTISYAKPGLLSPNDSDRDVLLVKKGAAEWARTPTQTAGTLRYEFDLKLRADGEISGWLTQVASGYYAASLMSSYQERKKERVRDSARSLVQGFFRNAEVVDVSKIPLEKSDGTFRLKTYFVVAGSAEGKVRTLGFPQSESLFLDPGGEKQRTTSYYLWPDVISVVARIQLPAGVSSAELPRPFRVESKPLDIAAKWEVAGQECRAELELHTKESLVPPERFETLSNALLSARAWLDRPLNLSAESVTPQPAAKAVTLEDFPIMGSGEGQLNLVEQRFPEDGDPDLRREALQNVRQYFPKDKPTLFGAGVQLALLDWRQGNAEKAAEQIRVQLRTYDREISRDDASWAQYGLAIILKGTEPEEALHIFERLSADRNIPEFRRAWSFYQHASLLEPKSLTSAIKVLREGLALQTEVQPRQFTLLAKLLIVDGRMAELKREIRKLVDGKNLPAQAMLTQLAQAAGNLLPAGKEAERAELIRVLEEVETSTELGAPFHDALRAAQATVMSATVGERLRAALQKHLIKNPPKPLDAAAVQFTMVADFKRAIDEAEKSGKPELCVRYELEVLTRFEADAEFPNYLWNAARFADWKERSSGEAEPILPVLLDLCDQLPSDNDNYFDGLFLRARGFERRSDFPAAQKIYEQILREDKLPITFKTSAYGRLAAACEARHEYSRALESYRKLEPLIVYGGAKDGLLRAVLLNLEMGNRGEALRILDLLGQRTIKALSEADDGRQILALVTLARDHAKAEAAWDAAAKWWPAWQAFEQTVGMKQQDTDQVVAVIPDVMAFGQELGVAAKQGQPSYFAKLRQAAHSARWEPEMTTQLAGLLLFHTIAYVPEYGNSVRQFVITMHDQFASDDRELRRTVQLQTAVAAIDLKQNAKAIEAIKAFDEQTQPDDPITQAMSRLRAIIALQENRDLPDAISALEKIVASPNLRQNRALSVTMLADLYQRANRSEDEEKLLERELENPQTKASSDELKMVAARLEKWNQGGRRSSELGAVIGRWLERRKPAWFDFAEPKNLDDPRLSNLDVALASPDRIFSRPECVKLALLVAGAESQPFEVRQRTLLDALDRLVDLSQTQEESRSVYDPMVEDATVPEWLRVEALWRAMFNASLEGRAEDLEKLRAHALVEKLGENAKAAIPLLREELAVDKSSLEALSAFCEKLLKTELSTFGSQAFNRCVLRLLRLGQVETVEKIYSQLGQAPLSRELESSRKSLQLDLLKRLNQAKKWRAVGAEMRQLVLVQFPPETVKEPTELATLHDPSRLHFFDEETATRARLFQIKTRQFDPWDLEFWTSFCRDLPRTEKNQRLVFSLIEAALRLAPGDIERGAVVVTASRVIDADDAALYAELTKLYRPYRDAEKQPNTYAQIRFGEIYQGWRSGTIVDVVNELENLHLPSLAPIVKMAKLDYLIRTSSVPELRKMLESMSPDELLSERLVSNTIRGFELAGMADELELARDTARKALHRAVVNSWVTVEWREASEAYDLAGALHEPALLPRDWSDALATRVHHQHNNLAVRAEDAELREEWTTLLPIADEAIKAFPTYYHFQWFKGAALYHLGEKDQAIGPLKTYTKFSRNERQYSTAMEWLRELQPAKAPE